MNLESYSEVHPSWETIQDLEEEEARAVLELLQLVIYIDDELTRNEVEMLTDEWLELPHVQPPPDAVEVFDEMLDTYATIQEMRDKPKKFHQFLDRISETIEDEDSRFAVFRLVAIAALADGMGSEELELCVGLGEAFGFDYDTTEDLLRSIWETHRRALDEEAGVEREIPAVLRQTDGSGVHRRSVGRRVNPFTSGSSDVV